MIHHGVDPEFFRIAAQRISRAGEVNPDKYVLTVSTLHPHKNIGPLMEAFQCFRFAHPEYRLVVAGLKGFAASELESRRRELGLDDIVSFQGWIPREALYDLFDRADAFIAPSLFEGFGMPVIEALAAGIPTACSAISPLREIAGEAAVQFDPHSVAAMAAALERIVTDAEFRSRATVNGPQRAREFDWEKAAELTLKELVAAARHGSA